MHSPFGQITLFCALNALAISISFFFLLFSFSFPVLCLVDLICAPITLLFTDNSSRQARQNNLLLDIEKHSLLNYFTCCCGVIDFGSLTQVLLHLFFPFGGFLSTFHLQASSEAVGLCKQSSTDVIFVDVSFACTTASSFPWHSRRPLSQGSLSNTLLDILAETILTLSDCKSSLSKSSSSS